MMVSRNGNELYVINYFSWARGSPSFNWDFAEFLVESGELVYFLNLFSVIGGIVYRFFKRARMSYALRVLGCVF